MFAVLGIVLLLFSLKPPNVKAPANTRAMLAQAHLPVAPTGGELVIVATFLGAPNARRP